MVLDSANSVLTNEEIDALLDLFANEGVPDELAGFDDVERSFNQVRGEITALDLLKPNRLTREQMVVIERIQEMVARTVSGLLTDRLRIDASCDCVAVEQLRFSSWSAQVEGRVGVYVLDLTPLDFPAVVTVSSRLLLGVVDRVLGGTGSYEGDARDLSEAESAAADSIVAALIGKIVEGLSEIVPVEGRIAGRYANLQMAQALPFSEVVLSVHYQVVSQPLIGDIRMVIPYAALEKHLDGLSKSRFVTAIASTGEFRDSLSRTVSVVPLELSVELGATELRLRELLSLSVGDIVPLPRHPGELVAIPVQGKPKFLGHVGTRGSRYAVRVREVLNDDAS